MRSCSLRRAQWYFLWRYTFILRFLCIHLDCCRSYILFYPRSPPYQRRWTDGQRAVLAHPRSGKLDLYVTCILNFEIFQIQGCSSTSPGESRTKQFRWISLASFWTYWIHQQPFWVGCRSHSRSCQSQRCHTKRIWILFWIFCIRHISIRPYFWQR